VRKKGVEREREREREGEEEIENTHTPPPGEKRGKKEETGEWEKGGWGGERGERGREKEKGVVNVLTCLMSPI